MDEDNDMIQGEFGFSAADDDLMPYEYDMPEEEDPADDDKKAEEKTKNKESSSKNTKAKSKSEKKLARKNDKDEKKEESAAPEEDAEAKNSADDKAASNDDSAAKENKAEEETEAEAADEAPAEPQGESDAGGNDGSGDDGSGGAGGGSDDGDDGSSLKKMMAGYYMEYASYVIKERAIPEIDDGLKPVQRRILWSLHEMDDGKLHKVANVVGNTMKYHPHGDSSIYGALVHIANKGYLIDRQGNFGNIYTGDPASAARYIECRLSELARETMFNRDLTELVPTYDSRNKEPVALPTKIPALLMQGSEGIGVGMATRIMPHNFCELLDAQIKILRNQDYTLYPDFIQGGTMDVSEYDKGNGRIKLRAKIETPNEKTLIIREIPASIDTERLITTIEDAAQKGKIKISQINDYTAEEVEIEIKLPRGIYADTTIKALYAFTDCEVSISCNCLVIQRSNPFETDVHNILEHNTMKLREDLKRELEIELGRLEDLYHFKTLAQIFIENRIYKRIEECTTHESVRAEVRAGLEPFLKDLIPPTERERAENEGEEPVPREITDEDIEKLLQIPIRRISLFDIEKNKEELADIMDKVQEALKNLRNLTKYTIRYIKDLLDKYGELYPRRTEIDNLEQINVKEVALQNLKVGLDRGNGYLGTQVKDDNPISCSEHDRLVIFKRDGTYKVIPVPQKLYVGPVLEVYKADKDQVYSLVYRDKKTRACYAKRFQVSSYIMDKEYRCCPKNCKIERIFDRYGVVLHCEFRPAPRQRERSCTIDFNETEMRSAGARGLKVTGKDIAKFIQVKRGSDNPNGSNDDDDEGSQDTQAPMNDAATEDSGE